MLVLMQSPDGGQMFVPEAKVETFLKDGWKVISRQAKIQPAPLDVEQALPEPAEAPAPEPKGKRK